MSDQPNASTSGVERGLLPDSMNAAVATKTPHVEWSAAALEEAARTFSRSLDGVTRILAGGLEARSLAERQRLAHTGLCLLSRAAAIWKASGADVLVLALVAANTSPAAIPPARLRDVVASFDEILTLMGELLDELRNSSLTLEAP